MKGAKGNDSLLQQLIRQGYMPESVCGGNGTCGKCRICVTEGYLPVTKEDKRFFTKEELDNGYRLACKAYPKNNVKVLYLDKSTHSFDIVSNYDIPTNPNPSNKASGYSINIDIGTTTIAMNLTKLPSIEAIAGHAELNPCFIFGSDVISRIHASNTGKLVEMQEMLKNVLHKGIGFLLTQANVSQDHLMGIVIAANTIMVHNLMGYSCKKMSHFPFTVDNLGFIETNSTVLWRDSFRTKVILLPYLSSFIGGDIISGLFYSRFHETEHPSFFLDLGTNGEMAVGNKDYVLCTSVAAGPAFEGGNISCGTGSVAGAVYDVSIQPKHGDSTGISCKTIGDKPPSGLCGTGAISLLYELRKNGWMSQTGLLANEYFDTGVPFAKTENGEELIFTQADIREMQLAIASVRAGMETLLKRYGTTWDQIDSFYLAGGFGYHVNIKKAVDIGLLPKTLKTRIQSVGNTSLGGACEFLASPDGEKAIQGILNKAEEISLGNDEYFQRKFITYMNFP